MKIDQKKYLGVAQVITCLPLISVFIWSALSYSCQHPVKDPPPAFIVISTFYKTNGGADLLNPGTPGSFKEQDLSIISKINFNGVIQDISYNTNGVGIYQDANGFSYIELMVPTNWGSKSPLATYVKLSPSITDTVTYTFLSPESPSIPDKIFYNKKLAWDIVNANVAGNWPPITIIK